MTSRSLVSGWQFFFYMGREGQLQFGAALKISHSFVQKSSALVLIVARSIKPNAAEQWRMANKC